MIYIENNVINLTRGDDASLSVSLVTDSGDDYQMNENEFLTFGVRTTTENDSPVILQIESEHGSNLINFTHAATSEIDVGFYSAEIQLTTRDGKIVTVWPKLTGNTRIAKTNWKNFCIMSEVVRE